MAIAPHARAPARDINCLNYEIIAERNPDGQIIRVLFFMADTNAGKCVPHFDLL
jgi:hypothetical protein